MAIVYYANQDGAGDGLSAGAPKALIDLVNTEIAAITTATEKVTVRIGGNITADAGWTMGANGIFDITGTSGTINFPIFWEGWTDNFDGAAPVIVDANGIGKHIFQFGAQEYHVLRNINAHNNTGNFDAFSGGDKCLVYACQACDVQDGFTVSGRYLLCSAYNCRQTGFSVDPDCYLSRCVARLCVDGFIGTTGGGNHNNLTVPPRVHRCISWESGDNGFQGNFSCSNCIAYKNGGNGFENTTASKDVFHSCVSVANSGWGYDLTGAHSLHRCAGAQNTLGRVTISNGYLHDVNDPGITTNPFFNADQGDFRLKSPDPTGGDLLRSAGLLLPTTTTTDFTDATAVQEAFELVGLV